MDSTANGRRRMRRNAEGLETRDSWGEVAAALVGGADERNAAMARATVRLAVSREIFCGCGDIMDTRRAAVIEDLSGRVRAVFCLRCLPTWRDVCKTASGNLAGAKGFAPGETVVTILHGSGKVEPYKVPAGNV